MAQEPEKVEEGGGHCAGGIAVEVAEEGQEGEHRVGGAALEVEAEVEVARSHVKELS